MKKIKKSSENIFEDLGLPHPEEDLAKAKLAHKINAILYPESKIFHEIKARKRAKK